MARPGILYSNVARAAAKLVEDGKNPTVDSVRHALGGTGSKSTIAPLLKRWKTEQQETVATAEAGLPASLLQAVKGLYQHMQVELAQRLDQAQQEYEQGLRAATEREEKLRTELQAILEVKAAQTGELEQTRQALAQLQATYHAQSVRQAAVDAENAGLQQRLADRAAEVATLDHQLTQARAQFEHYQEATAAQRSEEKQAYEQRIARLEQGVTAGQRHIAAQQTTIGQQEAKIAHLTEERERQRQALRTAQEELAAVCVVRDRLADRLEYATAAKDSLMTQLATAQQQVTEARSALAAKERETEMLAGQLRRTEERVAQLAEEKIAWLQERIALEQRTASHL